MGSYTHLRIGQFDVDWSKNSLGLNHSSLFTKYDLKVVEHEYADGAVTTQKRYERKLADIIVFLELQGFSGPDVISEEKYGSFIIDDEEFSSKIPLLIEAIKNLDPTISYYSEENEKIILQMSNSSELYVRLKLLSIKEQKYSVLFEGDYEYDFEELIESLHPYTILRIFALNPKLLPLLVVWEFYDLIEGGYIEEEEVYRNIETDLTYLFITEGSGDTEILKKAFAHLRPEIAPYFEFIDMEKNYPFTGVGNIVNFYYGLIKIRPNRKIIFLFDNDAVGKKAIDNCKNPPRNFHLISLPNLNEFDKIKTIGPSGYSFENINGKAVSIELFLDIGWNIEKSMVRWGNFIDDTYGYQGALMYKGEVIRNFHKAIDNGVSDYSYKKLEKLLDYIIFAITGYQSHDYV